MAEPQRLIWYSITYIFIIYLQNLDSKKMKATTSLSSEVAGCEGVGALCKCPPYFSHSTPFHPQAMAHSSSRGCYHGLTVVGPPHSSTCDPPHEQWLMRLGAGGGHPTPSPSHVVVVPHHHHRPTPPSSFYPVAVPPRIHPTSIGS
jgi:hypothetical protein